MKMGWSFPVRLITASVCLCLVTPQVPAHALAPKSSFPSSPKKGGEPQQSAAERGPSVSKEGEEILQSEIVNTLGQLYGSELPKHRDSWALTSVLMNKILEYPDGSPNRPDLIIPTEDLSLGIRPDMTLVIKDAFKIVFEKKGKLIEILFYHEGYHPFDNATPSSGRMVRQIGPDSAKETVMAELTSVEVIPPRVPVIPNPNIEIVRAKKFSIEFMRHQILPMLSKCSEGPGWQILVVDEIERRLVTNLSKWELLVARDKETKKIVGARLYDPNVSLKHARDKTGEELEGPIACGIIAGVLPEYKGQGIGRRLLQTTENILRERGVKTLFVRTMPSLSNTDISSYQLCRRMGYRPSHGDHFTLIKDLAIPKPKAEAQISGELKNNLLAAYGTISKFPNIMALVRQSQGHAGDLARPVLNNVQFRVYLPHLEWDQMDAFVKLDPAAQEQAMGISAENVQLAIVGHVFISAILKGQADGVQLNPQDVLDGKWDFFSDDSGVVERLLKKVIKSGQEEYSAPPAGLVLFGNTGVEFISDPDNPYASPAERFGEKFAIAGASVWEGEPYMTMDNRGWGYLTRQFYSLYKKGLAQDPTWIYPQKGLSSGDQQRLDAIVRRAEGVGPQVFYYEGMPVHVDGREIPLPINFAIVYNYGDFSFVIPKLPLVDPARGGPETTPVFVVNRPIERAIEKVDENKFKMNVRPLARKDAEEVLSILKNASRDRRWLYRVRPTEEKKVASDTKAHWKGIFADLNYHKNKEFMDGCILREIEIFIKNKGREEIEALRILDAGCGQGTLMRRIKTLIKMRRPDVDVSKITMVGIEPDRDFCEAARRNGLNVMTGSILNLPFPDNAFDIVIAEAVLDPANFTRQEGKKAIEEVHRVAKVMHRAGRVIAGADFVMMDPSMKGRRVIHGGDFVMWPAGDDKAGEKGRLAEDLIGVSEHDRRYMSGGKKAAEWRAKKTRHGRPAIWKTKEGAIDIILNAIQKFRPDIVARYKNLSKLSETEKEKLRQDIYNIKAAHFRIWGLVAILIKRNTPYFNGSHIHALLAVFPDLNLNKLGFQLDFSTKEEAIASVWYVFGREIPSICRRYERYEKLSETEREILRNQIYEITAAHMRVWGLSQVLGGKSRRYFGKSYKDVFIALFPKLGLNRFGFEPDWTSPKSAVESIRFILEKEAPHIMAKYKSIGDLNSAQIAKLKQSIYEITEAHFHVWGLGHVARKEGVKYFKGDYVKALAAVFNDPRLGFNVEEMKGFRKSHLEKRYKWEEGYKQAIGNIKDAIRANRPDIMERYNRLKSLRPDEKEQLKEDIYRLTGRHLELWGLRSTMFRETAPYFKGDYALVLISAFPDLNLNPLGFKLSWATSIAGCESIFYVLSQKVPDIIQRYRQISTMSSSEKEALCNDIYKITSGHFIVWGLSGAMNEKLVPYFKGSYMDALIQTLPKLELNRLGFKLDWVSSKERAIESIHFAISKEAPHIMNAYKRWNQLTVKEQDQLRSEVYEINQGQFLVWGMQGARSPKRCPYFKGSHIEALIVAFPELKLHRLGFKPNWSTKKLGMESIRQMLWRRVPDIMRGYENIRNLSKEEIKALQEKVYRIGQKNFVSWGLTSALAKRYAPYFNSSYKDALIISLPDLNLNPLGFELDWSSEERALISMRYVFMREIPDLLKRYDDIDQLTGSDVDTLRSEIYKISAARFEQWGMSAVLNKKLTPYFGGRHVDALLKFFDNPRLGLKREDFGGYYRRIGKRGDAAYAAETVGISL